MLQTNEAKFSPYVVGVKILGKLSLKPTFKSIWQNVSIWGSEGHGYILLHQNSFLCLHELLGVFGHLKFCLICVTTSVGRGGWQATWDNVPSLTGFFFDGFP
jgi:hypothetical protein